MKTKHFIFILILFQGVLVIAQEPMVAYRKEGIWHYFDTNGKLMWQPFADVASFPGGWHNGFLKAAAMNIKLNKTADVDFQRKDVLYDKKGKIVLQPKCDSPYRIMTGFDKAGYLQLVGMEENNLILCDREGNVKYKSPDSNCQYLGEGVVAYGKDGEHTEGEQVYVLWDVKTQKTLSEIKCSGFLGSFENSGFVFNYNAKAKYGMINRKGEEILPLEWESDILESEPLMEGEGGFVFTEKFVCLKNGKTQKWHLFNRNGQSVLSGFGSDFIFKNGFFTCRTLKEGVEKQQTYCLVDTNIKAIDEKYGFGSEATEGGVVACLNTNGDVNLMDKTGTLLATINGVTDIVALTHHFWIRTNDPKIFISYNEKGQKVGTIEAETIAAYAHLHVPFMRDGKWGLAHENGKVIVACNILIDEGEVMMPKNGFWEVSTRLNEDAVRFDFYNFQGKLAKSTTADKDGWDYILTQESVFYNYRLN